MSIEDKLFVDDVSIFVEFFGKDSSQNAEMTYYSYLSILFLILRQKLFDFPNSLSQLLVSLVYVFLFYKM